MGSRCRRQIHHFTVKLHRRRLGASGRGGGGGQQLERRMFPAEAAGEDPVGAMLNLAVFA
jgi:hypothetical protein